MSLLSKLLFLIFLIVFFLVGFAFFFRLELFVDEPIGIISEMTFPGSGLWRVQDRTQRENHIESDEINESITVIVDDWGVPHIYADNEEDLNFAIGYIHAKDRYFQMDMTRRQARGLISEIIGHNGLSSDKFHLSLGMEYWALRTIDEMSENPEYHYLMSMLEKYSKGVNSYLKNNKNDISLEYIILGTDPLKRGWSSLDTIVYSKVMSRILSWSYREFQNTRMLNAMGDKLYGQLKAEKYFQVPVISEYGDYVSYIEDSIKDYANNDINHYINEFLKGLAQVHSETPYLKDYQGFLLGSNNWVIGSENSITGHPILCNDMHLMTDLPNIWYEAHLICSDENINSYGYFLPGVPFPIVGFNEDIAWGFTNTGFNVIDWYYYEEIDEGTYIFDGEEMEFDYKEYSIPVRNAKDQELRIRYTIDGPVLSDHISLNIPEFLEENIVIAPRWTGSMVTYELKAINGFSRSQNIQDFDHYSQYFHNPGQNIVFADKENIALRPTGLVPIRSDGSGEFLYNGSKGQGRWIDFVPFDELPYEINPDNGFLSSANQIIVGPDYEYDIQVSWDEAYRARRINNLLRDEEILPFSIEDMKEMQNDIYSIPAFEFLPYFLDILREKGLESDFTGIYGILSDWDYKMSKDSSAPTIYKIWEYFYFRNTFSDEFQKFNIQTYPKLGFLEYITKFDDFDHWFNDINTDDYSETKEDIIKQSFYDAVSFLKKYYGTDDPVQWIWGDYHKIEFNHISYLPGFSRGPYPASGDGLTINPSPFSISSSNPRPSRWSASQRLIVDLSDPNNSFSCIPGGQSGRVNSMHYSDQLEELYLFGKYRNINFYKDIESFPKENISQIFYFNNNSNSSSFYKNIAHIVFIIFLFILSILYIKDYKHRKMHFIIVSLFSLVLTVYMIMVLNIPLWKAVLLPIIFFNLALKKKKNIFIFSILLTIIPWSVYILYSSFNYNTLENLRLAFFVITGQNSVLYALAFILLAGLYCGMLCALLSILVRKIISISLKEETF